MNERIKKLAEQAGYYLYDLTETHEWKTVETDSTDEWITLEKFAELIVKDTMQVVANQLPSNVYLDVANAVIEHYKEN
jgi:hypothetical protein